MRKSMLATLAVSFVTGCGGGGGSGGGALVVPPGPPVDVAAFRVRFGSTTQDLVVVDSAGGVVRSLLGTPANDNVEVSGVSWNPARTHVAFVADLGLVDEVEHVYVADATTGALRDLTTAAPSAAQFNAPKWSPDGQFLAFTGDPDVLQRFDLLVSAAAGGFLVTVSQGSAPATAARDVSAFEWSPDSNRLAYTGDMDVDGRSDLHFVDSDGSDHLTVPTQGPAGSSVFNFAWALADDAVTGRRRVGFRVAFAGTDSKFLFTVFEDGTGLADVGGHPTGQTVGGFQWAPGFAHRLAYSIGSAALDGPFELRRADAATGITKPVDPVGSLGNGDDRFFGFAGTTLVFQFEDDATNQEKLSALLPSGAQVTLVDFPADPALHGVRGFQAAPDGSRIAVSAQLDPARDSDDLFVFDADGTNGHQVNDPFPLLPDGGFVDQFVWSPDSSRIAFGTVVYPDEPESVFVAPAAGGPPVLVSSGIGRVESLGWTSNSARVLWIQDEFPDFPAFLATADGAATLPFTPVPGGDVSDIFPR